MLKENLDKLYQKAMNITTKISPILLKLKKHIKIIIIIGVVIIFIWQLKAFITIIVDIVNYLSTISIPLIKKIKLVKPMAEDLHDKKIQYVLEIIKNIGCIVGGAYALWLATARFSIADKNHKLELDKEANQRLTAEKKHELELKKEVNQRFSTAVELLGNKDESVRIGALYCLEQIIKEEKEETNKPHSNACMDVIAGYVRSQSASDRMQDEKFKQWQTDYKCWDEREKKNSIPLPPTRKLTEDIITAVKILSRNSCNDNKIDLKSVDWSGVDLRTTSITFKNIDFSYARFIEIKLPNKIFLNCSFQSADLTYADLRGVDLIYADLTEANLTNARLIGADLTGADLRHVDLRRAKLTMTDLSWKELGEARLTDEKLSWARLRGVDFTAAIFTDADLENARINKSTYDNSNDLNENYNLIEFQEKYGAGILTKKTDQ